MIILVGDIHWEWGALREKMEAHDLSDCTMICVGDLGIGFQSTTAHECKIMKWMNDEFRFRNIKFKSIRGNHDNPYYFDGTYNLSNFELIPDYSGHHIEGETWLFIGGAISVDRKYREKNIDWWEDEILIPKWVHTFKPSDNLVMHTGPIWLGPSTKGGLLGEFALKDNSLIDECRQERIEVESLIDFYQPKNFYCGHFHMSDSQVEKKCRGRVLDILEFYEHR